MGNDHWRINGSSILEWNVNHVHKIEGTIMFVKMAQLFALNASLH